MQLEAAFRRSLYLSLALASLALCVAEGSFLPEMPIVGGLVGGLLLVAYFLEGRWSLSLSAANSVGMVLTAILGIWIAYQFFRPQAESLIYQLPWPTSLLPYLGPVLLILIPAKLIRPKEIGDYWAMYGLGLMSMALGCAMAEEGLFGLLLVLWLIVFVWSLTLFYLYHESGLQPMLLMGSRPETAQHTGRYPLLRRASRWTFGVLAVGLVLFMATPRLGSARWQLTLRSRMETGLTAESQIDLTRTGSLNINDEVAFNLYAEEANNEPKVDLPSTTRFRNVSMVNYERGKWQRDRMGATLSLDHATRPLLHNSINRSRQGRQTNARTARLPDLGPSQFYLTIEPTPEQSSISLVMDPVYWKAGELPPIASPLANDPEIWVNWQQSFDTTFGRLQGAGRLAALWCETRPQDLEPDLGPTMYFIDNVVPPKFTDYAAVPNLQSYTNAVIERLIAAGKLSRDVRERGLGDGRRKREHHEAIARALCNYLASSGEFTYSLELQRKDKKLDPVEDFLYNTRTGHCQRFASALVFMLRTQGIPAQFVLGYKGCEEVSPGRYVIRQSHAHAWAEILIPRAPLPDDPKPSEDHARVGRDGVIHYHWLSLDPTPDLSADANTAPAANWLQAAQSRTSAFFRTVILGFNNDLRERTGQAVADFFTRAGDALGEGRLNREVLILGGLAGAPTLLLLLRGYRRRRKPDATPPDEAGLIARQAPFHARLLTILRQAGFTHAPQQTAREFATQVGGALANSPKTAAVAEVPLQSADAYYRVRFGDRPIPADEVQMLERALDRLEFALQPHPETESPA